MVTTKTETTTWTRYRRKKLLTIHQDEPKQLKPRQYVEYDVETMIGRPVEYTFQGEACFKIRTVRNLFYREEIHIPAFTYMPADKFLSLYERVS